MASVRIGCLGFGGPAGQIALMHKVFVDERRWLDEPRFLHALNFCMLLPGPEAQQLATYAGWSLRGVPGGLIAGVLFVLPGALVVLGLSAFYAGYAHHPGVEAAFAGVKAAVLALIAEAMLKLSRRALKGAAAGLIAAAAFVALVFGAPFPLVILAAALVGLLRARSAAVAPPAPAMRPRRWPRALRIGLVTAFAWLAPLAACALSLGSGHLLTQIGVLFSVLATVTFGGAYATLAYLQQAAVETQGWLSAAQMLDGLGLAEITPGPLMLINQYVGFMAGFQADGGGLSLALAGAAMATWCTFAPSFLWIFAGAPYADDLRANPRAAGALAAITAAALGVIAHLGVTFALATLWPGGPDTPAFAWPLAAIALTSAAALLRFRLNPLFVIVGAAAAGLLVAG